MTQKQTFERQEATRASAKATCFPVFRKLLGAKTLKKSKQVKLQVLQDNSTHFLLYGSTFTDEPASEKEYSEERDSRFSSHLTLRRKGKAPEQYNRRTSVRAVNLAYKKLSIISL